MNMIKMGNGSIGNTSTANVPQFGGSIWYVSKSDGDDGNSGETPSQAFETIGAAITASSAGDAINIMAGTYTETGLDIANDAVKLWCEIGTIIDPASGTALTLSGDYCKLLGQAKIMPAAGSVGLLLSGTGS